MTIPHPRQYTDTQRMELRSHVNLAGEVVARLWPMRTFISRNPLQGLEHLHFGEAVQRGNQLFGGRSYAPEAGYREAIRSGQIHQEDLNHALRTLSSDKYVVFGGQQLSHLDVLRTAMLHGIRIARTPEDSGQDRHRHSMERRMLDHVRFWIQNTLDPDLYDDLLKLQPYETGEWPYQETMATWCDRTLGTDVTAQINRQMIRWCAAFCDEGEAAWSMPHRDRTFFRAWKAAAQHDIGLRLAGITGAGEKVRALPDRPEDALLESLDMLKIPMLAWQDYLSLHIAALPGWAGFIKWRSEQTAYPWQESYRIDLNKYLAVRLFYERELVASVCRTMLNCEGHVEAIDDYARRFPYALWLRRALVSDQLPKQAIRDITRLRRWWKRADAQAWDEVGHRWYDIQREVRHTDSRSIYVEALVQLAEAMNLQAGSVCATSSVDLSTIARWLRCFSPRQRALAWLEASELSGQREVLKKLHPRRTHSLAALHELRSQVRPLAQFVFCIDVRSEVFRRHLETQAGYETFGFAGFFGVPVAYRSFDEPHEVELCPVLIKPKHVLREVPRTYHDEAARRRKSMAKTTKLGQELLHDLKHNVITPYVMVEAIGWFFAWPLLGKTFFPSWYHRLSSWVRHFFVPTVATTLTVDKLTTSEAQEMLAAEQRMQILRWLRERYQFQGSDVTPEQLERIRLQALNATRESHVITGELGYFLTISKPQEQLALEALRQDCRITARDNAARIDRLTRTGFTETEQAYYVETALRLMGITSNFGRLVFICAHGSTSDNNPYESALDCGACGGSHGLPNARAFATIANRPKVRELLAKHGITIPPDTYFVAALHDTTTDCVQVADLEDFPSTHRKELAQALEEIRVAGYQAAAERYAKLSLQYDASASQDAMHAVINRSLDWSQVRPEWGLARNSFFVIARRRLTQGTDLEGRSFLHSYDHRADEDGRLLEFIMTAPLIVAQWINAEYYFSTVDPDVYGSGSKIYHNVVGRIGVMSGNQSDLRMGLPVQTIMNGTHLYHEPKRLTALIEAPRERIMAVIKRQPLLEKLFNNQWLRLVALDPKDSEFYHFDPADGWRGGRHDDWFDVTCNERDQDCRPRGPLEVHH